MRRTMRTAGLAVWMAGICWATGLGAQPARAADALDEWRVLSPYPTRDHLFSVTFLDGRYVAMGGQGTWLESADGRDWTVLENAAEDTPFHAHTMTHGDGL